MCGRFLLTSPPEAMRQAFATVGPLLNLAPRYNVAPTQPVPIVRLRNGERELALVSWGLIPPWSKEGPKGKPLINARADGVATRPSFRAAFRRRRCLVPANGFYEWQARGKGPKQPYWIGLKGQALFAMAGIWEIWSGPEGETIETMAILTTDANAKLAPIHDRMPVILPETAYGPWLETQEQEAGTLLPLLAPYPAEAMDAYEISTAVNAVANDHEGLLARQTPPEPPPPAQGTLGF